MTETPDTGPGWPRRLMVFIDDLPFNKFVTLVLLSASSTPWCDRFIQTRRCWRLASLWVFVDSD